MSHRPEDHGVEVPPRTPDEEHSLIAMLANAMQYMPISLKSDI